MYIRSSDQDRTLESASAFAAGLIPADTSTSWSDEGLGKSWRPVPIHSVAWEEEDLLSKKAPCHEFNRLINESSNLPEARRLHKENRVNFFLSILSDFFINSQPSSISSFVFYECWNILQAVFEYVVKASGADTSLIKGARAEWDELDFVYDVLTCQQANGLSLPPWLNETVFLKMHELSNVFFHMKYGANGDRPRARLAGGNLLDLIVDRMRDKGHARASEFLNHTKLFVYSAVSTKVTVLIPDFLINL